VLSFDHLQLPFNALRHERLSYVMELTMTNEIDLTGLFNLGGDWEYAPNEVCQREGLWPNLLAYSKAQATQLIYAKQSTGREDFAVRDTGLGYLEAALKKGARFDGTPVQHALVLLVMPHPLAKDRAHAFRIVQRWTVEETRNRIFSVGSAT
jgi:hypothetical protein